MNNLLFKLIIKINDMQADHTWIRYSRANNTHCNLVSQSSQAFSIHLAFSFDIWQSCCRLFVKRNRQKFYTFGMAGNH